MAPWQGKWALVTGASAGIGWHLAEQLAAGGANLVLTARRTDRLEQLAAEITQRNHVQVEICAADLAQPQAPEEIFRFTQDKRLSIEVLINNAGFGVYDAFVKQDRLRVLEMLQVNVSAVLHLTHLFLPAMVERRSGYVMIVSSTAAFQPVPYLSAYAATKGFDLLFAEGIAEELRRYSVRVCALCPGPTDSEFQQVAGELPHTKRNRETAEKVARVGLRALAAGKPWVISGGLNWFNMEMQRVLPRSLVTRVTAKMFGPRER
jgi:short-subunit dehydrogenase